jgi:YidC/Oxa1 family membrane protein insertase
MLGLTLLVLGAEKPGEKQFWILDPLYTALGHTLAWFYGFVGDYGMAIVLLTVAVRILLIPLTIKQIRSMQAMQRLQPEIKRLQQQYKDDRQKLNEETMKFYREHKVNPLSGCLPLLLQMPVFIVLYRLISDLAPVKNGVPQPPKHIPTNSDFYHSLLDAAGRPKGKIEAWGMDLAERATDVSGFGKAWPYYLLILFVMGTGWYQQRQTMARQAKDGPINPQMQMMGKIFPIFFGFISITIPAGVVIYFAASNVWQIVQQAIMFRGQQPLAAAGPPAKAEGKPPKPAATKTDAKQTGGKAAKPQPKPAPKPRPPSGRAQPAGRSGRGGDGARSSRNRARPKGKPKRR